MEKGSTHGSSPEDTQAVILTSHFCPDFQILSNCLLNIDQKYTGILKLFKNTSAPALRTAFCILLQWFHHYRCIRVWHSFVLLAFPLNRHSSLPGNEETVLGQANSGLNSSGCCSPILPLPRFQALA